MRNLKKILALVLALVMSLSLMATAGASSFPDVDAENPYATAIEVLDELKVFQGYKEDGTFRPTETLNRAQAAVLVYRIATGDVEDKYLDNYTFMQQSKFADLDGYNWAKGYINYCQNAGIVVGTSSTTFEPGKQVTGYQLLVMLLRTLGYGKAGEFTDPKGWELQTAAIAEREGILKNVTLGDFGAPAPRQMVAEILFRGLLTPTVAYSALVPGGYTKSGETLGVKLFGLEQISGVVMANEWANLNEDGDSVLKAGTTELKLEDGSTRTLSAVVSEDPAVALDAVGLTYNAYIANGEGSTKRALTLEKSDVNVVAFNEGKSVKTGALDQGFDSLEALAKAESLSIGNKSEYYENYDQSWNEDCKSDYLIRYAIAKAYIDGGELYTGGPSLVVANQEWKDQMAAWVADGTATTRSINISVGGSDKSVECYLRTIRIGKDITKIDQDIMFEIFDNADRTGDNTTVSGSEVRDFALGEVYVGTTSMKDYSDDMSWKSFKAEYFIDSKNSRTFEKAENGESVRIVDNNGDGTAEYILKITYTLDQAVDTYKDTLLYNGLNLRSDDISEVYYGSEVAVGDVVVWNVIDGKASIWLAETDTDKIDTKNFRNITVTTEGGETYGQSGIANRTGMDQLIMNMNAGTEYIMYKDRFGFVRAYALAQGTQYALLTEMYPTSGQNWNYVNTSKAIAEVKIGEEAVTEYEVADGTKNVFFSNSAWTSRDQYFNTNYNYLQPAIAHLGNPNGTPGYFEGKVQMSLTNLPVTRYIEWNRRVSEMQNTAGDAPAAGDYGVFDYGKVNYVASSTTNPTGPVAIDGDEGTAEHSFSFTNVATYILNDDVVSLGSATKLAITQDGEQIYYLASRIGVDGSKTWQSKWIDEQLKNGSARTEDQLAVDFQDLVDGTNKGGQNGTNRIDFYPVYAVDYVQLTAQEVKAGTRHYEINGDYITKYNASSNGYVDATVNTEFYVVMAGNILYKVGYDELPNIKAENIRAAYAVAKNTTMAEDRRDYWVADVIVFEVDGLTNAYQSISLMYYNPWETVTSGIRYVQSLNNEWTALQPDYEDQAKMDIVPASVTGSNANVNWGNHSWRNGDYGFYALYDTELETEGTLDAGNITKITENWNDHGIYAGTVQRIKGILNSSGYIDVDLKGRDRTEDDFISDEWITHLTVRNVPIYRVSTTDAGIMVISETADINEVKLGDELIWVYNVAERQVSFIVDLGVRTKANDGFNYSPATWLSNIYENGTDGIIDEQTNNTVAPSYDWTVTLNNVDNTDPANPVIIEGETETYGVANGGTVAIPVSDVTLTGWTLGNVKNVTADPAVTITASGSYYLLQNITGDITVNAEQTKSSLTVTLTSANGTIQYAKNDGALAAYTSANPETVVIDDAYKFVVTGLNNTTNSYVLTNGAGDDVTAAQLTWNAAGTEATITGTMGGANVALTLTQTTRATTIINTGATNGAAVTYTVDDPLTGTVLDGTSGTGAVYQGTDVTFTVTVPANTGIDTVTYTVGAGAPQNAEVVDAATGKYKVPGTAVANMPITINVTTTSTAPFTVTFTKTATGDVYMTQADAPTAGDWNPVPASIQVPHDYTGTIRIQAMVPVTVTSGSADATVSPATDYQNYTISNITGNVTITIADTAAATGLTVTPDTLDNGGNVSIADAAAGATLKYYVTANATDPTITGVKVGMTLAEAEAELGATLTDVPGAGLALTSGVGEYVVVVAFNASGRVVQAGKSATAITQN